MVPTTVRASLVNGPATLLKDGLYDLDSKSACRVFFIILGFWQSISGWLVFFPIIQFSWLLFRSPSVPWLMNVMKTSGFIGTSNELSVTLVLVSSVLFYGVLYLIKHIIDRYGVRRPWMLTIANAVCALLIILFIGDSSRDFIYGQF